MKRGDYHADQENKIMIKPNIHSVLRNPQIYTFCKARFSQTQSLPVKVGVQHLNPPRDSLYNIYPHDESGRIY